MVNAEEEWLEQYLLRDSRFELALKSGTGEVASPMLGGAPDDALGADVVHASQSLGDRVALAAVVHHSIE